TFLAKLASNKAFAKADLDTGFIGRHEKELLPSVPPAGDDVLMLAATGVLLSGRSASDDPWSRGDGWRLYGGGQDHLSLIDVSGGQITHKIVFDYAKDGFLFHFKKVTVPVTATLSPDGRLVANLGGRRVMAGFASAGDDVTLFLDSASYRLKQAPIVMEDEAGEAAALKITAPMPGRIIAVNVAAGIQVEKGAALIVLEAMKMEHVLKAGQAGKIEHIGCKPGDQIREGQELLRFAAPA
ncbi:MAG TPA: biotin/lipoyl-containing protein, partial [Nordella sp.]|nr:biotin/lipoyl-containing protein [Nordella sp.]